jgi:hypothetical protein
MMLGYTNLGVGHKQQTAPNEQEPEIESSDEEPGSEEADEGTISHARSQEHIGAPAADQIPADELEKEDESNYEGSDDEPDVDDDEGDEEGEDEEPVEPVD